MLYLTTQGAAKSSGLVSVSLPLSIRVSSQPPSLAAASRSADYRFAAPWDFHMSQYGELTPVKEHRRRFSSQSGPSYDGAPFSLN